MSRLKTATSALTAALLVTGIGLAVAQTDDQQQPADPMAAATAGTTSEQTPADPNAQPPVDNTTQMQQQQQATPPVADPAMATPPANSTTPLPAQTSTDNSYPATNRDAMPDSSTTGSSHEPAPRADRN